MHAERYIGARLTCDFALCRFGFGLLGVHRQHRLLDGYAHRVTLDRCRKIGVLAHHAERIPEIHRLAVLFGGCVQGHFPARGRDQHRLIDGEAVERIGDGEEEIERDGLLPIFGHDAHPAHAALVPCGEDDLTVCKSGTAESFIHRDGGVVLGKRVLDRIAVGIHQCERERQRAAREQDLGGGSIDERMQICRLVHVLIDRKGVGDLALGFFRRAVGDGRFGAVKEHHDAGAAAVKIDRIGAAERAHCLGKLGHGQSHGIGRLSAVRDKQHHLAALGNAHRRAGMLSGLEILIGDIGGKLAVRKDNAAAADSADSLGKLLADLDLDVHAVADLEPLICRLADVIIGHDEHGAALGDLVFKSAAADLGHFAAHAVARIDLIVEIDHVFVCGHVRGHARGGRIILGEQVHTVDGGVFVHVFDIVPLAAELDRDGVLHLAEEGFAVFVKADRHVAVRGGDVASVLDVHAERYARLQAEKVGVNCGEQSLVLFFTADKRGNAHARAETVAEVHAAYDAAARRIDRDGVYRLRGLPVLAGVAVQVRRRAQRLDRRGLDLAKARNRVCIDVFFCDLGRLALGRRGCRGLCRLYSLCGGGHRRGLRRLVRRKDGQCPRSGDQKRHRARPRSFL